MTDEITLNENWIFIRKSEKKCLAPYKKGYIYESSFAMQVLFEGKNLLRRSSSNAKNAVLNWIIMFLKLSCAIIWYLSKWIFIDRSKSLIPNYHHVLHIFRKKKKNCTSLFVFFLLLLLIFFIRTYLKIFVKLNISINRSNKNVRTTSIIKKSWLPLSSSLKSC